jgi:hypothetical protein
MWKSPGTNAVRGLDWAHLPPLEAACEIQVDVFVGDKAVLKVWARLASLAV